MLEVKDIIKPENLIYAKTPVLRDVEMHYCPGCSHGVVHKLVAEVIEELGIQDTTIGVAPVGCSVLAYNYLELTGRKQPTVVHRLWPLPSSGFVRTEPFLPIRAMATWLPLELPKPFMLVTGARIL